MTDDDRITELESEVESLRETVEEQQFVIEYLSADADLEALDPTCPHCGEGAFVTENGISWKRVQCEACGHEEYI